MKELDVDLNRKIKPKIGAQRLVDKFPERIEILLDGLSNGMTYTLACQRASIRYGTFAKWMQRAEAGDPQYAELYENIKKAEAEAAYRWVKIVDTAATDGTWQAAAWLLERKYAKDYSKESATRELVVRMQELIKLYNEKKEIPPDFLDRFINENQRIENHAKELGHEDSTQESIT